MKEFVLIWSLARAAAVAGCVLVAASIAVAQPTTAPSVTAKNDRAIPAPAAVTVAVLGFEASTPAKSEMGPQLRETLGAMLGTQDGMRLVDRTSLQRVMQEHELSLTGLADPGEATRVGKLVGAQILVTGKAFILDEQMFVSAKIIQTESTLVETVLIEGKRDEKLSVLVKQLSVKVGEKIRATSATLTPEPADDAVARLREQLKGKALPRLAVMVSEHHARTTPASRIDPAAQTEMRKVLKEIGFEIFEGTQLQLAESGVSVIVKGEAVSEFAATINNLVTCSARAEIELIDTKTRRVLLSERATTRAADLSENIAAKTALQRAGRELGIIVAKSFVDAPAPATAPSASAK